MSSIDSKPAQIARRLGYFITTSTDLSNNTYTVVPNVNDWTVTLRTGVGAIAANTILQDMGEIAKFNGQLFRSVRPVTQIPAGGNAASFFIVMPGGEYPVQGGSGSLAPANVARLG